MDWILDEPYLEITSRCNLQCTHCYNASLPENCKELNLDQLKKCFLYFKNKSIKKIAISGGEPLTHPNIIEILKNCLEAGLRVLLATNGVLLSKNMVKNINEYVSLYQISLDGSEEIHDKIRGKGNYKKALVGINNLCHAGLNKVTRLRMTISGLNYPAIDSIIAVALDNNLEAVQFSTVRKQGRASDEYYELYSLNDKEKYDIFNQIEKLRREYKNVINISRIGFDGGDCGLIDNPSKIKPRIDSDGNVYPCHGFSDNQYLLGNIHNGIENVFDDQNILQFLSSIKKAREKVEECQKCIWNNSICKSGCPAQSYYLHGNVNETDDLCPVRCKIWSERVRSGTLKV